MNFPTREENTLDLILTSLPGQFNVITWAGLAVVNSDLCVCWGLTTHQPLWVILCHLPEKGRREIDDSRGLKERDKGERGNG